MKEFIAANGGLIGTIIIVMVSFNLLLVGVKSSLEFIKDKTKTDIDNKAFDIISKISAFVSKVLDMVGYNPEHK